MTNEDNATIADGSIALDDPGQYDCIRCGLRECTCEDASFRKFVTDEIAALRRRIAELECNALRDRCRLDKIAR